MIDILGILAANLVRAMHASVVLSDSEITFSEEREDTAFVDFAIVFYLYTACLSEKVHH